jgi:hypothetical protein
MHKAVIIAIVVAILTFGFFSVRGHGRRVVDVDPLRPIARPLPIVPQPVQPQR